MAGLEEIVNMGRISNKDTNNSDLNFFKPVVVITTAELHSTKLKFRFSAGSNPGRGVSEIYDCENL